MPPPPTHTHTPPAYFSLSNKLFQNPYVGIFVARELYVFLVPDNYLGVKSHFS